MLAPWKKSYDKLYSKLKSTDITLPTKVHIVKAMFFSSSHVWMWELDHKESCALKNLCFWTVVLERTLQSPLDCKIKPVHPKGNQCWILTGRTDAEAEIPILLPPDSKNWLTGKDPDAGKDWRQKEKGTRGWDGWMTSPTRWYEFEQAPGVGEGQGSLVCCSLWGRKESDTTEGLNWTEVGYIILWVNNIHLLLKHLKRNFWDTFYERWNECPAAVGCSVLLGVIDW